MKIEARIEQKRKQLNKLRPLPPVVVGKLKQNLALDWTYNSSAIEGNTLSLNETRLILEEGITVGGKSFREHLEVKNHEQAIALVEKLARRNYRYRERDILDLHALVMKDIDLQYAGCYRAGRVRIAGANFIPPNATKIPQLITQWAEEMNANTEKFDYISLLARYHHKLVWIHPFYDGNGRTARLVLNLGLMKRDYPPAIILVNDRQKYYRALKQADAGDYTKIELIVQQAVERSLDLYLEAIGESDDEMLSLSEIAAKTPYSQEYLSLLARTGKIEAYKVGRNWVSSIRAIEDYRESRERNRD